MLKRFVAVLKARTLEFLRDRASMSWNVLFPLLILVGFAFIFGGAERAQFKVGIVNPPEVSNTAVNPLQDLRYIDFVMYSDLQQGMLKVSQHGVDLLLDSQQQRYWINTSSAKGYIVEQLLLGKNSAYQQVAIKGKEVRYLDWVVPGILGMNMMFSSLFGVGYVIVRYRKNRLLKRLRATPLTAFEFLLAQVVSRLLIVLTTSVFVFTVCDFMFDFYMLGSYWTLLLVALLGGMSLIALGLLMAARSASEELTGGLLNIISWPMMILSGVWFSLEGAPDGLQTLAQVLPLTHLIDAARAVMTEGAEVHELGYHLGMLIGMTTLFLALGAWLFSWQGEQG